MMDSRAKTARKCMGNRIPVVYSKAQTILANRKNADLLFVLDIGCGYGQSQIILEDIGCVWRGTDLVNRLENDRDFIGPEKLAKITGQCARSNRGIFDMVLLSNVLNVQEDDEQLFKFIEQAVLLCEEKAVLICNYPKTPRRMPNMNAAMIENDIKAIIHSRDRQDIELVFIYPR